MGKSDKKNQNNLVQIKIKGRNQPTTEDKNKNILWVHKSEPIRYTLTELRQIKGKVDHNNEYKILGGNACYMIRKLKLNRRSIRRSKTNKQKVKEESKVLKSNLAEIKTEQSLGLDITSRNFTLILSNVQSIKNKEDIKTELFDDSNTDLAVLTETWLTNADVIWVQGSELHRCNYRIDECHRKDKRGGGLALVTKQNLKV